MTTFKNEIKPFLLEFQAKYKKVFALRFYAKNENSFPF
jgi:hypothetical protein